MPSLQKDFQTQLFHNLQPIAQHDQTFPIQNPNFTNSFTTQGNSFIFDNPIMLSEQSENIQNLNIPDHTLFTKGNSIQYIDHQNHPCDYNISKQQPLDQKYDCHNAMAAQQFKNSSKLQCPILSQESQKFNQNLQDYENGQNNGQVSSFNMTEDDNTSNSEYIARGRRKGSVENMILSHKDHMLLGSKVISGLQKNIVSLPFRQPVDIERFNIPDYSQIVKQPMDLRTIKRKIFQHNYDSVQQIYRDIQLIISNSMKYNQFNADFIRLTKNFQKSYFKIRRDCERNFRRFKTVQEKKGNDTFVGKQSKTHIMTVKHDKHLTHTKHTHHFTTQFPTNQVQIASNYSFTELIKLAKRIKKLQPFQQIELFKSIGISNTMTIDIKLLSTKQIKILLKEVQRIEKQKQDMIRQEEKKENSHLTVCDSQYQAKCQV